MSKAFDSISKGLRQAIADQRGKRVRGMRVHTPGVRSRIDQDLKDRAVKTPNLVTIAAMREARSMKRAKFRSAQGLFNRLEKAGAGMARKPAKKRR